MRKTSFFSAFVLIAFLGVFGLPTASQPQAVQSANTAYVSTQAIDLVALLPPPPAPDSAAQKHDLQAVLDVQRTRTAAEAARAKADAEVSVFRFADVLGPDFNAAALPKTAAFFVKVRAAEVIPVDAIKDHWGRPRPFLASTRVHPIVERLDSASYPSGHATFGTVCAIFLANMVPEKRAALFARGWEYGENRVMDGVHYPTDVEAGHLAGTVIAAMLMQDAAFKADFAAAKTELRAGLGLAP